MAGDNSNQEVQFKLDLDDSSFVSSAKDALSAIQQVGDPENLTGLLTTIGEIGIALGAVATAGLLFKEAIDLSEEAEDIQRVTTEFQNLSAQAGISARTLQEGLEKAAGGLIDTDRLLGEANTAIIKMGSSAAQLPAIMELARKATAIFGGDVNTTFNNLVTGIGNGNTRMLKQYGIVVDTTKAVQDFAKANNIAVDAVSEAGKRQAIMNAALEQGQARFAGISGDLGQTKTSLQLLSTTLTEIKDTAALVFEKTLGPMLHNFLNTVNDVAGKVKTAVTSMFGDGLAKNNAQIQQTEAQLVSLKAKVTALQQDSGKQGFLDKLWNGDKSAQIADLNHQIALTSAQLNVLKQVNVQLDEQDQKSEKTLRAKMGTSQKASQDDIINRQKQQADYAKFIQTQTQMDATYYKEREKNVQSEAEVEEILQQQILTLKQQNIAKIAAIEKNESLTKEQKQNLEHLQNATYTQEVIATERQMAATRNQLLQQYVNNSQTAYQGIERAARQMTVQAKNELVDFGKQGTEIMNAFKQNSVSAFQTMGAAIAQGVPIAQATTDAIRSMFLGMIGDIAIQDGTRMLLSGIWPPNPLALAGGAALIAFGGALKSLAGGGATTTSTGAVSTTPTAITATNGGVSTTQTAGPSTSTASATQNPQRSVSVNIAGNYFNTQQTQQALVEILRQETDATSFAYNQVGV